jgi:enoyl-CoA hydratase
MATPGGMPMPWSYVTIDRPGAVAVVRFHRKENLDAFNQQLVRELTEGARTFHDDLDTHYVVLADAGEAFSAGAKDAAAWQLAQKTDGQRRHRFYAGVRLCRAWKGMPQIAAMERMAVGAGVAIALACDWRVLGRARSSTIPRSGSA